MNEIKIRVRNPHSQDDAVCIVCFKVLAVNSILEGGWMARLIVLVHTTSCGLLARDADSVQ